MWVLTTRHGVIERQGDSDINRNGRCLLQFCTTNGLCIMNTFFRKKGIHKYTWYRDSVGQRSIINFCIVTADLFTSVVDVHVKIGAKLSTDHHVVACILRGLNHPRIRKQFRARRIYNGNSSSSSFEGYPLQVIHKQDCGQGFILLLPQAAALPESDAVSGVIKPASSFIQNRQTSCFMWCPPDV